MSVLTDILYKKLFTCLPTVYTCFLQRGWIYVHHCIMHMTYLVMDIFVNLAPKKKIYVKTL